MSLDLSSVNSVQRSGEVPCTRKEYRMLTRAERGGKVLHTSIGADFMESEGLELPPPNIWASKLMHRATFPNNLAPNLRDLA